MNVNLSNIVSVSDIQKNYRKIFDRAIRTRQPIVVMRDNKPDVAVIDIKTLSDLQEKVVQSEIADTLEAVKQGNTELKERKTVQTDSLADFF